MIVSLTDDEPVRLVLACVLISTEKRPLHPHTLRLAAKRLGILTLDDEGRQAVPRRSVALMREHYQRTGWVAPRRATSLAELVEAAK
jgi:hypothetical protein